MLLKTRLHNIVSDPRNTFNSWLLHLMIRIRWARQTAIYDHISAELKREQQNPLKIALKVLLILAFYL